MTATFHPTAVPVSDTPFSDELTGRRILCVDDDASSVQLISDMLANMGHQAISAASGAEALRLLQQEPVDLILLDILMPQMDGYETCRRILAHPAWQRIPVIMVTALADRDARLNGLGAGAIDIIIKPVDYMELSMRVGNLLKLKSLSDKLHHDHQAVLDLTDKMEKISQFQGRIDIPSTSIPAIWHIFLEEIYLTLKVDRCALFMVNADTHEFVIEATAPADTAALCLEEMQLQVESGVFAWVINRRLPALIPSLVRKNPYTILMLPLSTNRRTLGVTMVLTPTRDTEITQESLKLLGMLTKQAALVMENALLYDHLKQKQESLEQANAAIKILSVTDPLTGAFNRGYLSEHLVAEIKRARRYQRPLALILCDIDHFKEVNDTHGHQVGDTVLKEFVLRLKALIRAELDWIVRFGGEEFLLVLPDTASEGAGLLAERLRQAICSTSFSISAGSLEISASFGVHSLNPAFETGIKEDAALAEDMIKTADLHLYQAKNSGRNRVVGAA